MMKKLLVIGLVLLSMVAFGQRGIVFNHNTWEEAKKQAIKEKKLIFIDVYTQWCGPCLAMAEDVFTQDAVGRFYNDRFICLKIDAETEEWGPIARQYKVQSYPTFLFVDPKTEKVVHFSSSRQDMETFLFTGESAVSKEYNSIALQKEYEKGNRKPAFLLNYAKYMASIYRNQEVKQILVDLMKEEGYGLDNKDVWPLFVKSDYDKESPFFKELIANKAKYEQAHGKAAVDAKFRAMMSYCPDIALLESMPDFEGKSFLIDKNRIDLDIRKGKYEEAAQGIDALLANPANSKQELCDWLRFIVSQAQYQEKMSEFWFNKCLVYAQYMAYNYPERDNGMMHFNYTILLEKAVRKIPGVEKYLPSEIVDKPKYGEPEYSMRSPKLKQKPSRGKTK